MYGEDYRIRTIAILTTENPMGEKLSAKDNVDQYEQLLIQLKLGQFVYFPMKGVCGNLKHSVIIYNATLEDAQYLGDKFNQESIIFCITDVPNGKVHYEYWEKRSADGGPLKNIINRDEMISAADAEDFFSQISREFRFGIPSFEETEEAARILSERATKVPEFERLLNESLDESRTMKSRMIRRNRLYKRRICL